MIKRYSMAEARSKFRELVRQVRAGKTVELTRRGERVAVLIGPREYERLSRPAQCFSAAWNDFACKIDLSSLDIDPEQVFGDVRDSDPGRDRAK